MSTITLIKTSQCASADHKTITVTGDYNTTVYIHKNDIIAPFTDEEIQIIIKGLIRLKKKGSTCAEVNTALDNGMVVTL